MTLRDPVQEKSVATYITRLMSGVSKSAVLKAFPTRTVKRIDLSRFKVAHSNAPEEMVQTLVKPESTYRVEQRSPIRRALEAPREEDRFLVTFADFSQERAIWLARHPEGVVVHGPPGTGKSQVIVNIVADALAHEEKVLVVCQKKAALDVVSSRLRAVGLSDLIVQVDDAEADRRRVIEMLRDQRQTKANSVADRSKLAGDIESLEREFEDYRKALFQVRDRYGLSYRSMLARIARIEREHTDVRPLQALRHLLRDQTSEKLQRLSAELERTEELFWAANIPKNPWVNGKEALTGDRFELDLK